MKSIGGTQEVINNLMMQRSVLLARVGEAVEKSAVEAANFAKADHEPGLAHGQSRYENRTASLTRSLKAKLTKIDFDEAEAIVFSDMEYAYRVETIYPYLWPAIAMEQTNYIRRLKEAGYK
jgi:hypothetical protein